MAIRSAVMLLPDDRDVSGLPLPLMLRNIMGAPLLAWMVRLIWESGYSRFLLNCPDEYRTQALACFPEGSVQLSDLSGASLKHLLETSEEQLLVVTAPALLGGKALGGVNAVAEDAENDPAMDQGSGCYLVSAESIAAVCDAANFDLTRFASVLGHELTWADGAVPITDAGTLADVQSMFRQLRNYYLYADGVEIWDFNDCYVGPFAEVAPGAILMPGTILKGRTNVASGAVIGPNTLLENTAVGEDSTVNASQIYDSTIGCRTNVGPFAYVCPGCTVEDDSLISCSVNMIAPVTIGRGSNVAAGSTITGDVPEDALAIARTRQTVKEGWAAEHRKKGLHK